jgi:uncharacterized protein YndB with AHSA1/START domain
VTETQSVIVERELAHPPEKVWRALTQGYLIAEWLMPNDFEPTLGHRFNLRATPMPHWNGVVDCEVLAVEPFAHLSYSWNASPEQAAGGVLSTVTFTLTPTAAGTHLRMEQSGFRPDQKANYQGAKYGWQRFLDGLARVLGEMA